MKNEKKKKNNNLMVALIITGIVLVAAIAIALALFKKDEFHYSGWINCMPSLSESEADLCKRAKAAGYPYIAY